MAPIPIESFIDHTVLKPEAGASAIKRACEEALQYDFYAVCIAPRHVALAASRLAGSGVEIATVVGFPNGDTLSAAKAYETRAALDAGATEIDMVIPIGAAREGAWHIVAADVAGVIEAARGRALVKVILETAYLDEAQKIAVCRLCREAGADFVKTSTGFAATGATVQDVKLMRATIGPNIGVKAAGGIRDLETALAMLKAGANRLGCSASVAIVKESLIGWPVAP